MNSSKYIMKKKLASKKTRSSVMIAVFSLTQQKKQVKTRRRCFMRAFRMSQISLHILQSSCSLAEVLNLKTAHIPKQIILRLKNKRLVKKKDNGLKKLRLKLRIVKMLQLAEAT